MFNKLSKASPDSIMALMQDYLSNSHPQKVNLGIGLYYDEFGKIPLLASISAAQLELDLEGKPHTYPPIEGLPDFIYHTKELIFGEGAHPRIATIQTLGGSGALKFGAEFLHENFPKNDIWLSDPTWPNHIPIFKSSGLILHDYPYYDARTGTLMFEEMLCAFKQLPKNSIVLLHACCHNPTGLDLSQSQCLEVIDILKQHELIPFIDMAYQGFGDGIDEDAFLIRELYKTDITFFVSQSFSKNFALYGQRCGSLSVVCKDQSQAQLVEGQLKGLVRASYSCPPIQGARLVEKVLGSKTLKANWLKELTCMRERIAVMRQQLSIGLHSQKDFDANCFIIQKGMFSYTGLSEPQLKCLREEYAIYLVSPGRMCVAGLNLNNIEYVIKAFKEVMDK